MNKKTLRKEVIAARMKLSEAAVASKSAQIRTRLAPFWRRDDVTVIMTYLPFRNEVDTWPFIHEALAAGKRIVIPVCREQRVLLPSELIDPAADLAAGTLGILEPKPAFLRPVAAAAIDLIIVPGVAFSRHFQRLGYGGGYYDRFLSHLRGDVLKIAPCYELQLKDTIPAEAHDVAMDVLLTEGVTLKREPSL